MPPIPRAGGAQEPAHGCAGQDFPRGPLGLPGHIHPRRTCMHHGRQGTHEKDSLPLGALSGSGRRLCVPLASTSREKEMGGPVALTQHWGSVTEEVVRMDIGGQSAVHAHSICILHVTSRTTLHTESSQTCMAAFEASQQAHFPHRAVKNHALF